MSAFDYKGAITALVTPFKNGELDVQSFEQLIRFQLDHGIQGLVVNGTTAESPCLTRDEVKASLLCAKSLVAGQVPIFLGTGSNCTHTTVHNTQQAEQWGADAALVVVPYYNKPNQSGLVAHFKHVAAAVNMPVMLYNVPGRTVVSLAQESIATLAQITNIIGIKEASGEPSLATSLRQVCGPDFVLLSGDDLSCLAFIDAGGDGVISVASNVLPNLAAKLSDAHRAGQSRTDQSKWLQVSQSLGLDTNPIPVKAALQIMDVISSDEMRLPLITLTAKQKTQLRHELMNAGLLQLNKQAC